MSTQRNDKTWLAVYDALLGVEPGENYADVADELLTIARGPHGAEPFKGTLHCPCCQRELCTIASESAMVHVTKPCEGCQKEGRTIPVGVVRGTVSAARVLYDMSHPVALSFYLTDEEARALAQFCKRVTYADINSCAVGSDEAVTMVRALDVLQRELADAGFAPR